MVELLAFSKLEMKDEALMVAVSTAWPGRLCAGVPRAGFGERGVGVREVGGSRHFGFREAPSARSCPRPPHLGAELGSLTSLALVVVRWRKATRPLQP